MEKTHRSKNQFLKGSLVGVDKNTSVNPDMFVTDV